MKIIVQVPPDDFELTPNDLSLDKFLTDQETYCYFRDHIFLNGIMDYIKERHPGELKDMEEPLASADNVEKWFYNQKVIYNYRL